MKKPSAPLAIYLVQLALLMVFLWEELTMPTLIVGAAVIVLRLFTLKLHRWIPQLVGAGLFAYAGMKYGRFVSPEVGANILFSVVCLKLLEAKEERDWRMLTLGLFLLWSSGALFVKTPLYFIISIAGVFSALGALLKVTGEAVSVSWLQVMRWVLYSLPVTVILFFLLPRFQASVWTPPAPAPVGQIGFSEEARPGEVESLTGTGALAFHVTLNRPLKAGELYWRGATLSTHDEWNWSMGPLDHAPVGESSAMPPASPEFIRQSIIHSKSISRAFALATGQWIEHNGRALVASESGIWRFAGVQQVRSYVAYSDPHWQSPPLPKTEHKTYRLGISLKHLPQFQQFKGLSVGATIQELQRYFQRNGFIYSLAPGKITSLATFLERKAGWCSHYASATALILRALGHPARLVSGYLGGNYNNQSGHWTVLEDDAHVWLEVWDGDNWLRLDPTLWVAPDRLQYSGAEFIQRMRKEKGFLTSEGLPRWMRDTQMWIEGVNYRFLVWSEELDLEKQRSWANKLNWDLSTLYATGLWILGFAIGAWWLAEWWRTRPRTIDLGARRLVWRRWRKWWLQRGQDIEPHWGPERWRGEVVKLNPKDREFALKWIQDWEEAIYQRNETESTLTELARRL